MKKVLPYLILVAATFLLSGAIVVSVLVFRPDLLRVGHGHPPASQASPQTTDSTAVAKAAAVTRQKADTAVATLRAPSRQDSLAVMRDSVRTLLAALERERTKSQPAPAAPALQRAAESQQPQQPDTAAVKLLKARAKMLEAMPAEDAAKIVSKLSDDETRALLRFVKARQAAKILAAIEPERASRMFR